MEGGFFGVQILKAFYGALDGGTKSRTNFYVYDFYEFCLISLTDLSLKVSFLPPLVD